MRGDRWFCPVDPQHGRWAKLDDAARHMLALHAEWLSLWARWGAEAILQLAAQEPDERGGYMSTRLHLNMINRFTDLVDARQKEVPA